MLAVKSKTGPAAVSRTSMVTVNVPSVYVPSATGSILSSVKPAGQLGLPGTKTGGTWSASGAAAASNCAAPTINVATMQISTNDITEKFFFILSSSLAVLPTRPKKIGAFQ